MGTLVYNRLSFDQVYCYSVLLKLLQTKLQVYGLSIVFLLIRDQHPTVCILACIFLSYHGQMKSG